ncbi:MAG: SAM-dependent methyltransferase [Mucinivorans sp.]
MKLYLIPTPIGKGGAAELPQDNWAVLNSLDYFVVENLRTARRFIASQKVERAIDDMLFGELSEHTQAQEVEALLEPILQGRDGGLMSEAGLPCVADPGAMLVEAAHAHGIEVVPLVGASSLMLALMASGANGQSFAFNGYLPIKDEQRPRAIKRFEGRAQSEGQTQIFIETPYRNTALMADFLKHCAPKTTLCVAIGLRTKEESIKVKTIELWRKNPPKALPKTPAIFIIY